MDHLGTGLLLGVAAALLTGAGFFLDRRTAAGRVVRQPPSFIPDQPVDALPQHLAVETRSPFFSLSESAFFRTLEQALPPGYR
ncbi:hypothetical protein ACI3L1_19945, partial [Deinococcus sp. SM5_A1]|uniref:hypothetical protein n=1 Tax=Deinococcus sp. SM5_A1 TaxID=3379094 RepID=UPI00386002E7